MSDYDRYEHFIEYAREQAKLTEKQILEIEKTLVDMKKKYHLPWLVLKNVIEAYMDYQGWK